MPKAFEGEGWYYGPDGEKVVGFVEGTAWQPPGLPGHFDSWGTAHPGDLSECGECRTARGLASG